ncbi:hypothetical protein HDU97_001754 [Phlyctochytrium planicorne]|nr:hypothetical protein HDU97_001754 [Phlyctochytrium planicorne]
MEGSSSLESQHIKDILNVAKILQLIKRKIEVGANELREPLIALLQVCSLNEESCDVLKTVPRDDLILFLESVGDFVLLDDEGIVSAASKVSFKEVTWILRFQKSIFLMAGSTEPESDDGVAGKFQTALQQIIEDSDVPQKLIAALKSRSKLPSASELLRTIRRLSVLAKCCQKMIHENAVSIFLRVLHSSSDETMSVLSIETIWNLLSCPAKEEAVQKISLDDLEILNIIVKFYINNSRLIFSYNPAATVILAEVGRTFMVDS